MKCFGLLIGLLASGCTVSLLPALAFAAEGAAVAAAAAAAVAGADTGLIAIGAGLAIAVAVVGAGLAQGKAVAAALEAIGRNPSAAPQLTTPLIIGLVFMEALGILAFVVAYLLSQKI